jgi:hypothetical protein
MTTEAPVSKTAMVIGGLDRRKPISVSGDAGTKGRTMPRFGVFDARVRTADGREVDCVVKITPKTSKQGEHARVDNLADFQAEVEGAIAASRTGRAPEFLGVVEAQGGYAFAMAKVPGGFIHNESLAPKGSEAWRRAEGEAIAAREAVTAETPGDVRRFGEELEKLGYGYHEGEVQGLVDAKGRWNPIDFAGIRPLPTDPIAATQARRKHQETIEREALEMETVFKQKSTPADGPQRTGDPGSPRIGSTDVTATVEPGSKGDFRAEEPTLPGTPPPQHPLKVSDRDLTDIVAETLRLPVSPFKETRFYANADDFAQTFKAKWPNLPVPIAYHDPATHTLHIGPRATGQDVIHETVHKVAQDMNPQNRSLLGEFLDEGVTEWIARNRLGRDAASKYYNTNVAFVEYLGTKVGFRTMENLMLHGSYGSFRSALYEALGKNRAALDEFFYSLRGMSGMDPTAAASIRRLKTLLGD